MSIIYISRSVMSDSLCPMNCSLPGSPVHGIFQARVLEWVAISFSRGSSRSGIEPSSPALAGKFFTVWATRKTIFFLKLMCTYIYRHITIFMICRSSVLQNQTHETSKNWTIAPSGNTRFLQISDLTFSLIDQQVAMFHVCFCLKHFTEFILLAH